MALTFRPREIDRKIFKLRIRSSMLILYHLWPQLNGLTKWYPKNRTVG